MIYDEDIGMIGEPAVFEEPISETKKIEWDDDDEPEEWGEEEDEDEEWEEEEEEEMEW